MLLPACDDGSPGTGGSGGSGAAAGSGGTAGTGGAQAAAQDILTTDIALNFEQLTGAATVVIQPATGASSVTLNIRGLTVSTWTVDGSQVTATVDGEVATLPITDSTSQVTVTAEYTFPERGLDKFDGWMPESGATFLWPYFCGNLFPCNPNPDDGVTITMDVSGLDPSLSAVYPKTTTSDAPSYMPAVAVGSYTKVDLGKTQAGTSIFVWHLPGEETVAQMGTANLANVFSFYESTYGAYTFGPESGSVSVNWGPGAYGGMEHHPYVHIAADAMGSEETHAHEAAHGWYGDGVRIACWEDFMLSEGTVTYMAAHGLERVGGPNIWPEYAASLDAICTGADVNTIALPSTCNEIDLLNDDLWSLVPYIKGACFYEDVADLIGTAKVNEALGDFYKANVGKAAHMSEMIDMLKSKADDADKAKIDTFVTEWLLTLECPQNYMERCSAHQL